MTEIPATHEVIAPIFDEFFGPYLMPHEQRRRAAVVDGVAHGGKLRPNAPAAHEPITVICTTTLTLHDLTIYYTTDGTEPTIAQGATASAYATITAIDDVLQQAVTTWEAVLPPQPDSTLVRYSIVAHTIDALDQPIYADMNDPFGPVPPQGRGYVFQVHRLRVPTWAHDAVVYHVFVDRFHAAVTEPPLHNPGSFTEFFGGTLYGIAEKLDYIQQLGCTGIWLSPIFATPTYHGYNPESFTAVDPHFGGNAALHHLVTAVHARGMRIMLDFVANHVADTHALFRDAQSDPKSHYRDFFAFGPQWQPYGYNTYFGVKDMPQLTTDNPLVQDYLFAMARHWITEFHTDAIRFDYVSGPSEGFWTLFERSVKAQSSEVLTLGEISGGMAEVTGYEGRLDSYMDFPLAKHLRATFATRTATVSDLLDFMEQRVPAMPATMLNATLLDNHDMHRFLYLAHGDTAQLRLAAIVQMTVPGMPVIYYGTEVGLSQISGPLGQDVYARLPMLWGEAQDNDVLQFYQQLIALRRHHRVFRRGQWQRIALPVADIQVGSYCLRYQDSWALVCINASAVSQQFSLATIPQLQWSPELILYRGGHHLLQCEISSVDGVPLIEIPARESIILIDAGKNYN